MLHDVRRGRSMVATASAVLLAGALLVGCGGGGSSGDRATKTSSGSSGGSSKDATTTTTAAAKAPTTTTTEAATTTTSTPKPKASPQTTAGTLTMADMGSDWVNYPGKPVGESKSSGGNACVPKGQPDTSKAITARSDGKILQKAKLVRYAQTTTYEFPDAAQAEAFAQQHLTDQWIECARAATEASMKAQKLKPETYGVKRIAQAADFRGQYSFDLTSQQDGKTYSNGWVTHDWYRKGPVVVDVFLQEAKGDTDPKDIDKVFGDELNAGMAKVLARLHA